MWRWRWITYYYRVGRYSTAERPLSPHRLRSCSIFHIPCSMFHSALPKVGSSVGWCPRPRVLTGRQAVCSASHASHPSRLAHVRPPAPFFTFPRAIDDSTDSADVFQSLCDHRPEHTASWTSSLHPLNRSIPKTMLMEAASAPAPASRVHLFLLALVLVLVHE